jgi:hypothetical protein
MVHVIGKLAYSMLNIVSTAKYSYHENPIFNVKINGITIPNRLIEIGVIVNVMTQETMGTSGFTSHKQTSIVLQMEYQSILKL